MWRHWPGSVECTESKLGGDGGLERGECSVWDLVAGEEIVHIA